jgi:3-hydroxyacyl-[acyl-carrier-protein] dehydratase
MPGRVRRPVRISRVNVIDLLPHEPPMRLIEEVVELEPGARARCRRTTRPGDFFFDGHFPGHPVVPAVILVEMVAQAGGLAAGAPSAFAGEPLQLRVAALGPFKFPAAAGPDAVLEIDARVAGSLGGMFKIDGTVTAGGQVVAAGSVTLAHAARHDGNR